MLPRQLWNFKSILSDKALFTYHTALNTQQSELTKFTPTPFKEYMSRKSNSMIICLWYVTKLNYRQSRGLFWVDVNCFH